MKHSSYKSSNFTPKVLILDIEKAAHAGATVDVSHAQNLQVKCCRFHLGQTYKILEEI